MSIYYWLAVPALIVIIITAVVRGNNMPKAMTGFRWNARRIGLLGIASFAVMVLAAPFTESRWNFHQVDIPLLLGIWGWALTWMTTPGMPPWHRYVLGMHRHGKPLSFRNECRALWRSFNAGHEDH